MFPSFLAFIQHVLNLSMGVCTYFELVHLLCFAVKLMQQHFTSASLLEILSFSVGWMPEIIAMVS